MFERRVYLVVGPHGFAFETMTDRGDHPRFNLNVTFRAENVEGSVLVSFHLQPIYQLMHAEQRGKRPCEAPCPTKVRRPLDDLLVNEEVLVHFL